MKFSKFILASILALAFAGFASAQTVVHITGSTAFRAAAHQAILGILQSGATYGYTGTSLGSAGQAIFTGTTATGSIPVIIKTSWSGSVGGIIVLTKNFTVPDTAEGVTGGWLANSTPQSTTGTGGANPANIDPPVTADVTFSDSFQSSTIYPSPILTGANGYKSGVVGVIPFQWVAGNGDPATITNITNQVANLALSGGLPLSQLTGLSTDEGTIVEVLGRDSDSGTRLETYAETGFGTLTSPTQYQATVSGGVITSLDPWPAQVTDGTSYPSGHEGYSSGGSLATALNTPGAQTAADNPGDLIGYLGITDAASVTTGRTLSYAGVAYSPTAVYEGQYTFWAYEHVYYRSSYVAPGQTVANQIAAQIHNVAADTTASGLLVTNMHFGRIKEGGPVTFGNPY